MAGRSDDWRDLYRREEPDSDIGYLSYNETVIEHFMNPHNVGLIEDPDGQAVVGDPTCGDYIEVCIKVETEKIVDFKFLISGCPAAIATSSIATELAIGKTIEEAMALTDNDVIVAAGGIPARKAHCSLLAIRGLHQAIRDYLSKNSQEATETKIHRLI
jgi:nitrogen fixation NifU-like protein